MTYKTILVHMQLGRPHDALLHLAKRLADRYNASVIGVAASQLMPALVAERCPDGLLISGEIVRETAESKDAFFTALGELAQGASWLTRGDCSSATRFIGDVARGSDLLLTDAAPGLFFDAQREINMGELLMRAGRPILIAPTAARPLQFQHALLAWDDSRECRRAASDALPLLRECASVTVLQLVVRDYEAAATTQLKDVVAWLERHEVASKALVLRDGGNVKQIALVAGEHACDLIIAGAYGHSRLQEWTFGGVTHELLSQQHVNVMFSH